MPVSSSTDDTRSLTIFTVVGELTFEEQMKALRAFYSGSPTANVLWDFRLMEGNRSSSTELVRLFSYIKSNQEKRSNGETALVAATDLDFGLSRVSETLSHINELPWDIQAFRSMNDALQWIDNS